MTGDRHVRSLRAAGGDSPRRLTKVDVKIVLTSVFTIGRCSRSGSNEATMAPVPFAKRLEPSCCAPR